MTVQEAGDGGSEDGLDYLASLFQNADYTRIMQVNLKKDPIYLLVKFVSSFFSQLNQGILFFQVSHVFGMNI